MSVEAPPLAAASALFDAVLYPNRSLGAVGFYVLMAAIVAVSAAVGAGFMLAGAWPVTGFLGLDVLLLYLAFRWNYRQGRRAEFIRLDGAGLTVRRVEPDGQAREWRLPPYWVRVTIDDPPCGRSSGPSVRRARCLKMRQAGSPKLKATGRHWMKCLSNWRFRKIKSPSFVPAFVLRSVWTLIRVTGGRRVSRKSIHARRKEMIATYFWQKLFWKTPAIYSVRA